MLLFSVTAAALIAAVSGHATVQYVALNGVKQPNGVDKYVRTPVDPGVGYNNGPVKDVTSADMACNNNNKEVPTWLKVKAGDDFQFEWHHDPDSADVIADSHKGPVMTYISTAAGKSWVKLAEDGYKGGQWGVDRLIAAKGRHGAKIPNLAAGKYLMRADIIGLHEGDAKYSENPARGAQFYPACVQIEVTSAGSVTLPAGVSFPGAYKETDPGVNFNLYGSDASTYKIPGPAVWNGASGGASAPAPEPEAPAKPSSSVKPTVVAPPSSTKPAPVVTPSTKPVTVAPAPTTKPTTKAPVTSPKPTTKAPTIKPTTVKPTSPAPKSTTAAPPKPSTGSGSYTDYNTCMRAMNECRDKINRGGSGSLNFSSCDAIQSSCNGLRRMHKARSMH